MRSAQLTFTDILRVIRRRRRLLILPPVIITSLAVVGAFILPPKYESSATILVQRDEILNPLISFTMAVTIASEDRLRTFNEIIYSQSTIQILIDSLRLGPVGRSEAERQELIKEIRRNIQTDRRGSDSFKITFFDGEPERAQKGVLLLSNVFIQTILRVENQRNELAVQFFENKLEELRYKFEESQKELTSKMKRRIEETPSENRAIYSQMEDVDRSTRELDEEAKVFQQGLAMLRTFPQALHTDAGKQTLFAIVRLELPHVSELRTLVTRYEEYSRRYTTKYPEVQKLGRQILDMVDIMKSAVESEVSKARGRKLELLGRRAQLVTELKQSSVSGQVAEAEQSNYGVYRGMFDDMKIKLEQARTARDLGRTSTNQFIIIDPPLIPTDPAKPNKMLIILAGLFFGTLLGMISAATAELADTKIKTPVDIEVFNKPIIAFLPDGDKPVLVRPSRR